MAILVCTPASLGKVASAGTAGLQSNLYFYVTADTIASIQMNYGSGTASTYFNTTTVPFLQRGDLIIALSSSEAAIDLLAITELNTVGCSLANLS